MRQLYSFSFYTSQGLVVVILAGTQAEVVVVIHFASLHYLLCNLLAVAVALLGY